MPSSVRFGSAGPLRRLATGERSAPEAPPEVAPSDGTPTPKVFDDAPPLPADPNPTDDTATRAAVKSAIQPLDFLHRVVCIDGAHDRENRVPRVIEVPIKTQQGIARQRAQSGLTANAPASNAMLVVQQFVQSLRRHRRRIVSLAFRFLNDHLELTRELR